MISLHHLGCFNFLNRGIWRSSISILTKVQLYCTYIQPVLLYGSETWALTRALLDKVDAFDNVCLRRILRIPYMDHVANATVRFRAGSLPQLSQLIQRRWLRLFGHVARMDASLDISRALRTSIRGLSIGWKRPPGRPRHTWLRTLGADLQPHNHGLNSAWKYAQDREHWKYLVETATLLLWAHAWWWWFRVVMLNTVFRWLT